MNRTGHPNWVKMFGDSNGQIKLRAKQKYKFLSATSSVKSFPILVAYWQYKLVDPFLIRKCLLGACGLSVE